MLFKPSWVILMEQFGRTNVSLTQKLSIFAVGRSPIWNHCDSVRKKEEFEVKVSLMYSLADPHSAPVCSSDLWPQSAPELPCCGQSSTTVPVVQDQGRGELWQHTHTHTHSHSHSAPPLSSYFCPFVNKCINDLLVVQQIQSRPSSCHTAEEPES